MRGAGFDDPVLEAQGVFRALLDAMARPGRIMPVTGLVDAPMPLTPTQAAIALTLLDFETSVWLDEPLAGSDEVRTFLAFHTGVRFAAEPANAAFALVADTARIDLARFGIGTDTYPDRSTTVVLSIERIADEGAFVLSGPGIKRSSAIDFAPLPRGFLEHRNRNRALFPRGIDLVLAGPSAIAALPRTTIVQEV